MNHETRRITDGAMMAAIIGVMLLINRQTAGLIEVSFVWALPLPMVFYAAKYGYKNSLLLLAAVIFLTFVLGTPQTLFYIISEMLIGLVYGGGIYHKTSSRKIVIRTIIMAVIADILSMLVFATFFGYDIASEITEYKTIIHTFLGANDITMSDTVNLDQTLKTVIVLSVILSGVLEGLVTHLLSRLMLKRLRIYVVPMTPFIEYCPPKWSGYVGIACLVLYYVSIYKPVDNDILQGIMQGFGLAGTFFLAVMGMLCISLYLNVAHHMKGGGMLIGIALMLVASVFVALLGFLYITTDIRSELMKGGNEDASENS